MDFKSILNSLSTIAEGETQETEKGRVHKGTYGNKYGKEDVRDQYGHRIGRRDTSKDEKKEEPKRGRGRPKKDAGDAGVGFDTSAITSAMGGKKPKKEIGKVSKKHSLKEYIDAVESKTELNEEEQVTIAPAQQNTQVIKQGNKVLGSVTNPQLAQQIKQSIGKGEMSLAGDEIEGMAEAGYSAKAARAGKDIGKPGKQFGKIAADASKRYGSKERGEKVAGAVLAKLRAGHEESVEESGLQAYLGNKKYGKEGMDALRKAGRDHASKQKMANIRAKYDKMDEEALDQPATMEGAPEVIRKHGDMMEKAPPGAKAERMVKHIKKSYAKDGKITPKEKSIAYATAWKAHNKGKVEESFEYEGVILTEGAMKDLVIRFIEDLENGPRGYNIMTAIELKDRALAGRVIDKLLAHGDRYKRLAGTLKSQLRDAALEEFGFVNAEESLEEADTRPDPKPMAPIPSKEKFTTHGMDSKVGDPSAFKPSRIQDPGLPAPDPMPWSRDPIQAFTDRALNVGATAGKKASNFIAGLRKPKLESTDMKDIQLEGWEKQLNSLLNEGITVSSSTGQQGSPDSVSITASDADAQTLMGVLRNAGIGGFGGGGEKPMSGYGAPTHDEEPTGTGTEPQPSPEVVGDGDDMLSLIKKMTGIDMSGQKDHGDYEDENGDSETMPQTLEPADSDPKSKNGGGDDSDKEDKTDEGNDFTEKLKKTPKGEKFSIGGKEYTDTSNLEEDDMEEGAGVMHYKAQQAKADGKESFKLGDKEFPVKEDEHTHEGDDHKVCNECGGGMYEGHTCGDKMDESFANEAGKDGTAEAELAKLKALLSMGNDLHKMKRDQTVLNPTQVTMAESLAQWKRLSGIK